MNLFQWSTGFILIIQLSGCAAIGSRAHDGGGKPFAGVRADAIEVAHPSKGDKPFLWPLSIIDLPLSFAMDLILLPYDFMVSPKRKTEAAPLNEDCSTGTIRNGKKVWDERCALPDATEKVQSHF